MTITLHEHLRAFRDSVNSGRGLIAVADVSSSAAIRWSTLRNDVQLLSHLRLQADARRDWNAPKDYLEALTSVQALQEHWLATATEQDAEQYVPELLATLQTGGWDGQFGSTQSIIAAVATTVSARLPHTNESLTVFDPAVGTGLLVRGVANSLSASAQDVTILGQEIDEASSITAAAVLSMGPHRSLIANNDSLVNDEFEDRRCEVAICDIPHGMRWNNVAETVHDRHSTRSWYREGLPSKSDSSWLFISRMLAKLRTPGDGGGCVVAVVSGSTLFAKSNDVVRTNALEQDLIDAVIALPAGLAANTRIPLFLMVLSNNKMPSRRGKVQLIDLRGFSTPLPDRRKKPSVLDQDAYTQLANALISTKQSPISRMIPIGDFSFDRVHAQRGGGLPSWSLELASSVSPEASDRLIRARYGPIAVALTNRTSMVRSAIEFGQYFDDRGRRINRALKARNWPASRLSAVLSVYPKVYKPDGDDLSDDTILLPVVGDGAALAPSAVAGIEYTSRLICFEVDPTLILVDFLRDWLSSKAGREARESAAIAGATGVFIPMVRSNPSDLMRFADSLIIPLPDLSSQSETAAASAKLGAAESLIHAAAEQLWTEPDAIGAVLSQIEPLFDDSTARWSASLPYPIASSLWTLETQKSDVRAAHRQIFLVWEAYAAFMATLLLSAVRQDSETPDLLIAEIRIALGNAHLSTEHMGFGGWCVITQRLSAEYRRRLNTDNLAEIAEVTSVFAGIGAEYLKKILDSKVIGLLSEANSKRNAWMGHSGSISDAELESQFEYMSLLLERLRGLVGDAWKDITCVRAGGVRLNKGRFYQQVELVTGDRSPFVREEREVGQPMEEGELYVISSDSAQPLRLESSVVLRSTPGNVKTTCYFYNRMEAGGVRRVAFHLSDSSELVESGADMPTALQALRG